MAKLRVDLTSKEASKIARANRMIDRIRFASGMGIVLFIGLIAIVFGYFFFLNSRVNLVDTRVERVTEQVQAKAETEILYRRLADIASEARSIVVTRQDYAGVLLDVYTLLPDQALVEGVRFEDGYVVVDIRTIGVQEMGAILTSLGQVEENGRFGKMTLESVRRGDNGNYFIRVQLELKENE